MDSTTLGLIEKQERDKYTRLYKQGYGATGYQRRISELIKWTTEKTDKVLDLGCGMGLAVEFLLKMRRNAYGLDITLAGVDGDKKRFIQAPMWDMPCKDKEFDCTFSVDVMEHIRPEVMDKVIDEIFRITRSYTFHVICTRPSEYESSLHPTVRSIDWWKKTFQQHNKRNIKCIIMDSEEFLMVYNMKRIETMLEPDKKKLTEDENEKYTQFYNGVYAPTGYVMDLAKFIVNTARHGDTLLDMGTGHGRAVLYLRDHGYNCLGGYYACRLTEQRHKRLCRGTFVEYAIRGQSV